MQLMLGASEVACIEFLQTYSQIEDCRASHDGWERRMDQPNNGETHSQHE